jgi:DNA polymerase I-like protein with 3'-5' exonuclease and polymerase domains
MQILNTVVIDSTQELSRFCTDLGFNSWGLRLPQVEYDIEEGERLLVILSHAMEEDVVSRSLGKSPQGLLVKNLIEQLARDLKEGRRKDFPLPKHVSLINYRDRSGERLVGKAADFETDYAQAWVARVCHYIKDFKPTRIFISGEDAFQAILYHTQTHLSNHKDLKSIEYTEPYLSMGRVFDFFYGGLHIPTSFTLPLHYTSKSRSKNTTEEESSALINQQRIHLEHLMYGRNLYTITDKTQWKRIDIKDYNTFLDFLNKLKTAPKVAIDLETDNLSRFANKILTMHFSLDGETSFNLPYCHRETPFLPEELEMIKKELRDYFQDSTPVEHIYHNAKFDIGVLMAQLDFSFYNHKVYDTQAGMFSLDENIKNVSKFISSPYALRTVAYQYGCSAYDEGEVRKEDRARMASLPLDEIFEYASKDVVIPFQVSNFQVEEAVRRQYNQWKTFVVEQLGAMTLVFAGMENKGILINKKYLLDLCSNDGIVRKLLDEVIDKFKESSAAREVNTILVVHGKALKVLNETKKILKRDLMHLKKASKTFLKKKRVLKKDMQDAQLLQQIQDHNNNADRDIHRVTECFGLYEKVIANITEIEKTIEKDIYNLRDYDDLLIRMNIREQLQTIKKKLPETSTITFIETISKLEEQLKSLKVFRDESTTEPQDWLFNIAKSDCQQLLFFDILGLKPLELKKDGGATTNQAFQQTYLNVPEVSYLATYNKYKKLLSTYIEGMMKRLETDPDSCIDGRLRASYGYRDVVTGRASSGNPNFQNIVRKGELAKTIKSQFVAGPGEIYLKNDYNAAEVRQWANISQDTKLANTFRAGMVMRKEIFLEQDPEKLKDLEERLKGEGDVHRLNYSFFFNKNPKDVTDEERNAVKAVIFGVMYGKSHQTLAEDLKCSEEQAQKLLDKLFSTYSKGRDWIYNNKQYATDSTVCFSPIGRVRHLAAILHQDSVVKRSTERKMSNSVTQGFSSDLGFAGGRILQQLVYKVFKKQGYNLELYQNNTVHDSVEAITKFEHLPISSYVLEQAFTTLAYHKYKKMFNVSWVIESEMDSEVGCTIGTVRKASWKNLPDIVRQELLWSQEHLGYEYSEADKAEILRKFDHNYHIITGVMRVETKKYLDFIKQNPGQVYLESTLLCPTKTTKLRDLLLF